MEIIMLRTVTTNAVVAFDTQAEGKFRFKTINVNATLANARN